MSTNAEAGPSTRPMELEMEHTVDFGGDDLRTLGEAVGAEGFNEALAPETFDALG